MKKLTWFLVVTLACSLAVTSCKKAAKAPAEGEGTAVEEKAAPAVGGGVAADVLSKSLSEALCKRMIECAPETMEEADCVTQTGQSLTDALTQSPIDVSEEQLTTCVSSIKSGTCEEVMGTKPPTGCEFLQ